MLKNKTTYEMSREKYIAEGKKLAEEKQRKAVMRKAVKPNKKSGYH